MLVSTWFLWWLSGRGCPEMQNTKTYTEHNDKPSLHIDIFSSLAIIMPSHHNHASVQDVNLHCYNVYNEKYAKSEIDRLLHNKLYTLREIESNSSVNTFLEHGLVNFRSMIVLEFLSSYSILKWIIKRRWYSSQSNSNNKNRLCVLNISPGRIFLAVCSSYF